MDLEASMVSADKHPPKELDPPSQAALSWFFGRGRTAFEKSAFGFMLERAELFGHGSIKCRSCSGSGVVFSTGDWCGKCKGVGALSYELPRETSEEAMPANGEHDEGGGYTPDDGVMTRYAVISRRLGALPRQLQAVLEAYHGDHGDRCADAQAWRMVAVYPLTQAGQKLVKMALELLENPDEKLEYLQSPAYERAFRQVAAQRTNPKENRGALITAAEAQATKLYLAAVEMWQAVSGGNS